MHLPYHYFASSAINCTKRKSLEKCLNIQRYKDEISKAKNCNIYRVSGDISRFYEIELYKPVVPEHHKEFVALVIY